MITTLFKAFEDITNAINYGIKNGTTSLIETVINHDYNEKAGVTHISINLTLKHNTKENE